VAFVNACEAGRVRGEPSGSNAAAFAELFLRSGMDAYLGTYWEVGDAAAALFAGTVYTQLAMAATLEQATLAGRKALFQHNEPDWANYMLFGGGNFRLVREV
jgi:CHAT domain-containing protein